MLVAERGRYIGDNLLRLREDAALTQEELGKSADVHPITISTLENNARTASARTLKKLAAALGVNVRELTTPADKPPSAIPDEPGLTEENEGYVEEIRQERKAREDSDDAGGRTS